MSPKYLVNIQEESRFLPHLYLEMACANALEQAEQVQSGSVYFWLTAMVMSAFYLESFLNYLGRHLFDVWEQIEKSLSPEQKLALIAERTEFRVDRGVRPFQGFNEIFRFRNDVVHAKPEYSASKTTLEVDESGLDELRTRILSSRPSRWLSKCTSKDAKVFFEDAQNMVEALSSHTGISQVALSASQGMSWQQLPDATGEDNA